MKRKYLLLIIPIIALILMLLPNGIKMKFVANVSESGQITYTYEYTSFFSDLPLGYAYFSPMLTAIFNIISLIMIILYIITDKFKYALKIFPCIAFAVSLLQFCYSFNTTAIVYIVIVLLLVNMIVCLKFSTGIKVQKMQRQNDSIN